MRREAGSRDSTKARRRKGHRRAGRSAKAPTARSTNVRSCCQRTAARGASSANELTHELEGLAATNPELAKAVEPVGNAPPPRPSHARAKRSAQAPRSPQHSPARTRRRREQRSSKARNEIHEGTEELQEESPACRKAWKAAGRQFRLADGINGLQGGSEELCSRSSRKASTESYPLQAELAEGQRQGHPRRRLADRRKSTRSTPSRRASSTRATSSSPRSTARRRPNARRRAK